MRTAFGGDARVEAGLTLPLSDASEPEPDAIVATTPLEKDIAKEDVLLVVEVSDSTLRTDRTTKAALYARHGIPEYLILDVMSRRAELRRRPRGTSGARRSSSARTNRSPPTVRSRRSASRTFSHARSVWECVKPFALCIPRGARGRLRRAALSIRSNRTHLCGERTCCCSAWLQ